MSRLISVIRSLVAFSLGLMLIDLFHTMASPWLPGVYAPLQTDAMRWAMLALVAWAGVIGCFVVATVVGRRILLNMAIFMALMLAVDLSVDLGDWAPQPFWFKALIIAIIPLQAWLGSRVAAALPLGLSHARQ